MKKKEKANLGSLLQKEDKKGLTAEAVACDALYDFLANRLNMGEKGNETLHWHLLYLETDPEERRKVSRKRRRIEAKLTRDKARFAKSRSPFRIE